MTLSTFLKRVVKGHYAPRRHAKLDDEIRQAQESMRLNALVVESGARAVDRMSTSVRRIAEDALDHMKEGHSG